jgi:hypothetical protein
MNEGRYDERLKTRVHFSINSVYYELIKRELKRRLIYEYRCNERLQTKMIVYYESIKREPKIRGIYECRCDERLQTKSKEND